MLLRHASLNRIDPSLILLALHAGYRRVLQMLPHLVDRFSDLALLNRLTVEVVVSRRVVLNRAKGGRGVTKLAIPGLTWLEIASKLVLVRFLDHFEQFCGFLLLGDEWICKLDRSRRAQICSRLRVFCNRGTLSDVLGAQEVQLRTCNVKHWL